MDSALRNAIFKIGEVISVAGREVKVKVDKSKNLSHLVYQGQLIKNVSVGGYVKVSKGFVDIIAKVEGESVCEQKNFEPGEMDGEPKLERILTLKLLGHIENHRYNRGIKEMPLLGNECFLLTQEEFSMVHSFKVNDDEDLTLGTLLNEDRLKVRVGAGHLLSSHIGIFGNTGSGKSYTLAHLYKSLFDKFAGYRKFKSNAQFLLFDFNGEYASDATITNQKKVYNLKTLDDSGDKLPIKKEDLLNVEIFSILAKASEKTQQPFIKRALNLYRTVFSKNNTTEYARGILRNLIKRVLEMADNIKGNLLLDYLEQILPNPSDENGMVISLRSDIFWHSKSVTYYTTKGDEAHYFNSNPEYIESTLIYQSAGSFDFSSNLIDTIIKFMYIQLINDVLQNRANNDHIAPAINKLKSVQRDFDKVFVVTDDEDFWQGNYFVVVNLNEANLEMKKLVPLLLAGKLYAEHKRYGRSKYLNIIIDEAHNILSYESLRESESWKDFRLETFEEIIKEGRKFGVFLTIASQRPSDISATIISQLHNYFIHRLINEQDIKMIEKAVSYLDRLSIETLPILPVGACIMSGLIADVPVIVQVSRIPTESEPKSQTLDLISLWKD